MSPAINAYSPISTFFPASNVIFFVVYLKYPAFVTIIVYLSFKSLAGFTPGI